VVGDARVRALDAEADADVAEHVVRQRLQEPHRVDAAAELAAERRERALGLDDQREVVVLVLVVAAARSRVEARALGERRGVAFVEAVAVRDVAGFAHRFGRGVEPHDVGAADELQELAIAASCAAL
jgi:hypothetical protein